MSPSRVLEPATKKSKLPTKALPLRDQLIYIAELAGESNRYEDVIANMKLVLRKFNDGIQVEERNLISVAYKNRTNSLRNSWRVIDTVETATANSSSSSSEASPSSTRQKALLRQAKQKIENELMAVCRDILQMLDGSLIPRAKDAEERVFYSKMKGDYYRYMAEFAPENRKGEYADKSLDAYRDAYEHARDYLEPISPTRLGLALNFSVFYHDVRKSPVHACHLAKSAFDNALESLNPKDWSQQSVRDAMMILSLLKDDLVLWAGEINAADKKANGKT